MKRHITILFTIWVYLFLTQLEALNRDYQFNCEKNNTNQNDYHSYCLYHAPGNSLEEIPSNLLDLIPATGPLCRNCYDPSSYLGYLDSDFKKYLPHLKQQLEYCSQYNDCDCLWPEYSQEAAEINDIAYLLFQDLISKTALSNLIENENAQNELIENLSWFLNKHRLTILFIAQQFRFSDYYLVCRDIESFAISKYEEKEAAKIKDKLQDILEVLYPKFFILYISCYKKHPNPEIDREIRFMKLLVNDISGLEKTIILENKRIAINTGKDCNKNYINTLSLNAPIPSIEHSNKATTYIFSPQSDIFLEQGTLFNNLLLYKEAIHILTQAIQLNPSSAL